MTTLAETDWLFMFIKLQLQVRDTALPRVPRNRVSNSYQATRVAPSAANANRRARAYHHILKLARTVAGLAGGEEIRSVHLAEMLQSRPKIDDRVGADASLFKKRTRA